jgi:hypothetical protein
MDDKPTYGGHLASVPGLPGAQDMVWSFNFARCCPKMGRTILTSYPYQKLPKYWVDLAWVGWAGS